MSMDRDARVTIIALSPELNGTPCTVVSFDASQGLYEVLLEPGHGQLPEQRMQLQPANLTPHASPLDEARAAVAEAKANGPLCGLLARFEAGWQADPQAAPLALQAVAPTPAGGTPAASAEERALRRREEAAALHTRLCGEAAHLAGAALPAGLLDLATLGSDTPAADGGAPAEGARPFACAVRIEVAGQTPEQAVEQGEAVITEVLATYHRGPVSTSTRQLRPGAQHFVLWRNLGPHSLRVQPNKSNGIQWLGKSLGGAAPPSDEDPKSAWPPLRRLCAEHLPHAASWVEVLTRTRTLTLTLTLTLALPLTPTFAPSICHTPPRGSRC